MSKQEYPDTMRVGLFSPNVFREKGGVQRLSCELASYLVSQGHCVSILHTGGGASPCFPLPDVVRTQNVGEDNGAVSVIHARQALLDHKLDVFCVMGEVYAFLDFLPICNRTGIPLILSEHAAPAVIEAMWGKKIHYAVLAAADGIHVLSDTFRDEFPSFLRERTWAIPNAVPRGFIPESQKQLKRVLVAARLEEKQKQLSMLIEAFHLIADRFTDWECRICGDGPQREVYSRLIDDYNLASRITLAGVIEDMPSEYAKASLFCMPSLFEGCPIALLEAQAFGLPAIGFAACPGVNDAIVDGINGLLVHSMTASALAEALARLMDDVTLRERLKVGALRLNERYAADSIYPQWERMLAETARCKGSTRLNYTSSTFAFQDEGLINAVLQLIITGDIVPHGNYDIERICQALFRTYALRYTPLNAMRKCMKHMSNINTK